MCFEAMCNSKNKIYEDFVNGMTVRVFASQKLENLLHVAA